MNPEACCSSSCCYSSLQRTVRNYPRPSLAIRILSKQLPSFFCHNDGFFRKPTSPPLPLMRDFFLKSTRPSLPLKKAPPLISVFSPHGKKRKPLLLVARNHFILWMADHQRSRQQQSCVLRYATAWTKENEMAAESPQQHALKSIAARPEAQKPTAARPEGAEALSPGQRPGF